MRQFSYSTLAVATVLAMGTTAANAAPEIHGRLVLGMVAKNNDTTTTNLTTSTATKSSDDRMTMDGNARIRVSGEEKINDKLDLEYWLDYNITLEQYLDKDKDNKQQNFTSRNTYLGLKHKDYGNVQFGRLYTPDDDIDYVDQGYFFGADVPWSYLGERTNNTLRYTTPGFGKDKKTTATFQYALDEGKDSSDLAAANILHDGDKLKLGASHVNKNKFHSSRLMVAYEPNEQWGFGTLAQYVDYNTSDDELAVLASARYNYSKDLVFYGQVGLADNYKGHKDGEKLTAGVGAISTLKKEGSSRVRVFSALNYADSTSFEGTTKTKTSGFALEAGLRYDF